MSRDEVKLTPVDEGLPAELARVESTLAALSLPVSRVDRDQMMFSAGLAAAVTGSPAGEKYVAPGRSTTLKWSAASAVLAASMAVIVMMWLQAPAAVPIDTMADANAGHEVEARFVTEGSVEKTAPAVPKAMPNAAERGVVPSQTAALAPLLALRGRLLRANDPMDVMVVAIDRSQTHDGIPARAKTSREMLRDFLPERPSPAAAGGWVRSLDGPWNSGPWRETL